MGSEETFLNRHLAKKIGGNLEFVEKLISASREGHLCILSDQEIPVSMPLVREGNRYYLEKNWKLEAKIRKEIGRLQKLIPPPIPFETELEKYLPKLQSEQAAAIRTVFDRSFTLICGGPGSGKTYTAAMFVQILSASLKEKFYITLAAPTGKAASHLQKTLGVIPSHLQVKASTLHRLLLRPGRIDADLVIVDEGSMIDVSLWGRLLEAIGDQTRLVVLGDPDQLPPVEAGAIFSDMGPHFGVSLNQCMRTNITHLRELAQAIRAGDGDRVIALSEIHPSISAEELLRSIDPWTGNVKPEPAPLLEKYRRLGILNALRQGPFGSEAIQTQILTHLANRSPRWWAIPILVTSNEPRLELYNGTFGILVGQGSSQLLNLQGTAYFPASDGTLAAYPSPPPIEPAFCISIHKSQGSEFEEVVAIFPQGSQRLGREALYTAITRAKKKLTLIGEEKTLREMIEIRSCRVSGLSF